jgi:hypothetical protein
VTIATAQPVVRRAAWPACKWIEVPAERVAELRGAFRASIGERFDQLGEIDHDRKIEADVLTGARWSKREVYLAPDGVEGWRYLSELPVVLYGHDRTKVIGMAHRVWFDKRRERVRATLAFAKSGLGLQMYKDYRQSKMTGFSVRALPLRIGVYKEGEQRWARWELLEISAVRRPMDWAARVRAIKL